MEPELTIRQLQMAQFAIDRLKASLLEELGYDSLKGLAEKQNTNQAGTIVISHLGKDSERRQKGKYRSNSSGGTLIAFS